MAVVVVVVLDAEVTPVAFSVNASFATDFFATVFLEATAFLAGFFEAAFFAGFFEAAAFLAGVFFVAFLSVAFVVFDCLF